MLFLTTINLNKNELQNVVIQNLASDPANGKAGQIYFNTTNHTLKQFNGTSWDVVGKEYTLPTAAANTLGGIKVGTGLSINDQVLSVTTPTDNNFTTTLKNKLDDIEANAEVNVIETINVNGTALTPASKVVNIYTITTATFADDTTATAASPVKMTLTDGNSQTVVANIPKVSSSSAGVAPKGASVSTQSQTTKFLREDGTWAAPSYTSVSDYVKKDGTVAMTGALNMNSHKITSVTDPTSDQDAATKKYVDGAVSSAINGLPDAMVFKGTVGKASSGTGTVNAIPTSDVKIGDTYKIVDEDKSISASASTTGSAVTAKIGDTIVATATTPKWTVIPSGDEPSGTVTSVRVQATSPVQSSVSTAQSTSLNTTISLADSYGDTKNPYGTKDANKVLAGPASGNAAAPSFRALVAADIPDLSGTYQAKGNYKTTQTAVSDPSVSNNASALEFISGITQNTNGEISPTKKKVAADGTPTENSTNLITSGAVYSAIQTVTGGATSKKTATNPALTASGGAWTWSITSSNALGTADITVTVYKVSDGTVVIPEIAINQSTGAVTITINDTEGASSLAAGTYKAVMIG